ncbi:MAG: PPK2 family polyphosphate kinase [Elusimicrobiota bacterium]
MDFLKKIKLDSPGSIKLLKFDSDDSFGLDKEKTKEKTGKLLQRLFELQHLLYAENKKAMLVVLQGMDTSGKDGLIRCLAQGLNPQGADVIPFKAPSQDELEHDFLWRIYKKLPAKGDITIFNRSHYEDVLVVRVHNLVPKEIWEKRYDQINRFEKNLIENNTVILKFFLNISKEEQKQRLLERLKDPMKNWKFNPQDVGERKHWNEYQKAYECVLSNCSKGQTPWFVVPSNKKWVRNFVVASVIVDTLEKMKLKIPKPNFDPSKIKVI